MLAANIANPNTIDARLVKSTWRRMDTRRSTSGLGVRSSHQAQNPNIRIAAPNKESVSVLVQPQSPPLEMASSRAMRAAESEIAPPKSNVPPVRTVDSGTRTTTRTAARAPSTADAQNRTCQSAYSAIKAAIGRPRAPPTPSEALIIATAPASFLGGSTSRITLMPSGMTPAARPCRIRPATRGITLELSAPTTEPVTNSAMLIRSRRRLPNMSPKRPMVGTATAAASSVAVTAHAVSDAGAFRYSGRCGMIGITSVCMSETTMPENARTATTAVVAGDFVVCGGVVGGGEVVDDIAVTPSEEERIMV